jgi:hypothetical protein
MVKAWMSFITNGIMQCHRLRSYLVERQLGNNLRKFPTPPLAELRVAVLFDHLVDFGDGNIPCPSCASIAFPAMHDTVDLCVACETYISLTGNSSQS